VTLRAGAAAVALAALAGAAPLQLDSQYVLQRYALAIAVVPTPEAVIFSYSVSQVGPSNIEELHRIYRAGTAVRDETLAVDGMTLRRKIVRVSHREDRYAVERIAPRSDAYELLFLGTTRDGRHFDYVYETSPLGRPTGAWIDRLTIDGVRYLPRVVHFRTAGPDARGSGDVEFGSFGKYWLPVTATAAARVNGKPARERITWTDYSFPQNLPSSTFAAPAPLPRTTTPPM
jgi:hypothetical protein